MLKRIINFSITIVCLLFFSACGKMPDSSEGIYEGGSGKKYVQQDELENIGGEAAETEEIREYVRIQGHSVLEKNEFTSVTLKDMECVESDLQVIGYSRKRPGGHLRFDQGNGIIYVTGEPDGQLEPQERSIIGVILIDDQFSITGGIKAGMEISKLEQAAVSYTHLTLPTNSRV